MADAPPQLEVLQYLQGMIIEDWDAIVEKHPVLADRIPNDEELGDLEHLKNLIAAIWSNNFHEYETEEPAVEKAIAEKNDLNDHLTELQNLATTQSVDKDAKMAAQRLEVRYAEEFLADAYDSMENIWENSEYGLPLLKASMRNIAVLLRWISNNRALREYLSRREYYLDDTVPGPVDSSNMEDALKDLLKGFLMTIFTKKEGEISDSKRLEKMRSRRYTALRL